MKKPDKKQGRGRQRQQKCASCAGAGAGGEKGVVVPSVPMSAIRQPAIKPGTCIPWQDKRRELPKITGDEGIFQRVWEDNEALAYMYIWQVLLSF